MFLTIIQLIDQALNFEIGIAESQLPHDCSKLLGDGVITAIVVKGEGDPVNGDDRPVDCGGSIKFVAIKGEGNIDLCVIEHIGGVCAIPIFDGKTKLVSDRQLLAAGFAIPVFIITGYDFLEFGNLQFG